MDQNPVPQVYHYYYITIVFPVFPIIVGYDSPLFMFLTLLTHSHIIIL